MRNKETKPQDTVLQPSLDCTIPSLLRLFYPQSREGTAMRYGVQEQTPKKLFLNLHIGDVSTEQVKYVLLYIL